MIAEKEILVALQQVMDPELGRNIVDLGMVRRLAVSPDGKITFDLVLTVSGCPMRDQITQNAVVAVKALSGVSEVIITPGVMTEEERKAIWATAQPQLPKLGQFSQIKKVIAVMSGKGGVGKSSVTGLLANALVARKKKVGILDADITDPSIPHLFGLPPGGAESNAMGILPAVTRRGIRVMSMNLLVREEDTPILWRGPMIAGAIRQFWTDVLWGKLDVLLVDMPPGTSDAALTVTRLMPLNGVVLVTTPQDLAAMVVRKGANMLAQLNVPVLGIIENMSYFDCPDTGKRHMIFGPSHAQAVARAANIPVWARLPVDPALAVAADQGKIEEFTGADPFQELALKLIE